MPKYTGGKYATQFCDVCGFRFHYGKLKPTFEKGKRTGILACPECWDDDHPQLRAGETPTSDPQSLRDARPDPSLEASRQITVPDPAAAQALGVLQQLKGYES